MMDIKDTTSFGRDIESKAVINNNKAALVEIQSKRQLNKRIQKLESDITHINSQLNAVVGLLTQILEKHGN